MTDSPRIAIVGAGAMGCLMGGKLIAAGYDVQLMARGAQLAALKSRGLSLQSGDKHWHGAVKACEHAAEIGVVDYVLITTKSHQLADVAPMLAPLLSPQTVIVPALNGIPWWYFQQLDGALGGRQLRSLDPDGVIAKHIPAQQVVGCVNYAAAQVSAPGVIDYVDYFARSMVIGELDGQLSPRLNALHAVLAKAGLDPAMSGQIRHDIWHKLWGNIAFNPISALTHATMDAIAQDYDDTDLVLAIMNEARHIAEKLGIDFPESPRMRIAAVAKRKGHKTSMLQDMELGRKTEVEAIVGAVREIGLWLEESMPHLNSLYSLVKLKERFFIPSPTGVWQSQSVPPVAPPAKTAHG